MLTGADPCSEPVHTISSGRLFSLGLTAGLLAARVEARPARQSRAPDAR
jgi:hypothetical protein